MNNTQAIYDAVMEFNNRLVGAIDMWTVACLDFAFPSRQRFLAKNVAKFQSTANTLSQIVDQISPSDLNQRWPTDLKQNTEVFCNAFTALEDYHRLSTDDLEQTCHEIATRFKKIDLLIKKLKRSVLLSKYEWPESSERERYLQDILDGMADQFSHARSSVTTT